MSMGCIFVRKIQWHKRFGKTEAFLLDPEKHARRSKETCLILKKLGLKILKSIPDIYQESNFWVHFITLLSTAP